TPDGVAELYGQVGVQGRSCSETPTKRRPRQQRSGPGRKVSRADPENRNAATPIPDRKLLTTGSLVHDLELPRRQCRIHGDLDLAAELLLDLGEEGRRLLREKLREPAPQPNARGAAADGEDRRQERAAQLEGGGQVGLHAAASGTVGARARQQLLEVPAGPPPGDFDQAQ